MADRVERLTNLLALLLETRRPLTLHEDGMDGRRLVVQDNVEESLQLIISCIKECLLY